MRRGGGHIHSSSFPSLCSSSTVHTREDDVVHVGDGQRRICGGGGAQEEGKDRATTCVSIPCLRIRVLDVEFKGYVKVARRDDSSTDVHLGSTLHLGPQRLPGGGRPTVVVFFRNEERNGGGGSGGISDQHRQHPVKLADGIDVGFIHPSRSSQGRAVSVS